MNLAEYLGVLAKRWKTGVSILLIFMASGIVITLLTPKKFEATAEIFVSTADVSDLSQLAQGSSFTQGRVQSYVDIATSPRVTDPVVQKLGLTISGRQLASMISADAPLNKVIINLHVVSDSADQSALLANAVANQFGTVVENIDRSQSSGSTTPLVSLSVIQPAVSPGAPISPNRILNISLAFVLGLMFGLIAAFVREALDNTIKTSDDLAARATVPTLGVVPLDKAVRDSPISFREAPHSTRAESFRRIRTNMQFVDVDSPPRVIAITSALPGEGKTHIALNFAAALAEAGARVCVLEADLRKPTIARTLGLVSEVGLTSVLIGKTPIEDVLQNAGQNLAVMTSGPVPPNPSELLVSGQCRRIVDFLASQVDIVVIDTAPLLPVSDGAEISAIADATILVVRAGKTTRDNLKRSIQTLENVGVRPVGTVLSMASGRRSSNYNYYYYSGDNSADDMMSPKMSTQSTDAARGHEMSQ